MMSGNGDTLLDPSEVEAINLFCTARVRELIYGEHASVFTGTGGFDFSGIRDFEPGDPQSRVDWAHSTTTLYNPLQVKECIEERSVNILIAADISCSTRFGTPSALIGKGIARAIATIGFSASIFQDTVGLVLFPGWEYVIEAPRGGRRHVERIVELYQTTAPASALPGKERLAETLAGELRRTSMVVVASDFLFPDLSLTLSELAELQHPHDVFLVMADSAFAYEFPDIAAGWIRCGDSETGDLMYLSNSQFRELPELVRRHQEEVAALAERAGLEILRIAPDARQFQAALVDFFMERRMRRR